MTPEINDNYDASSTPKKRILFIITQSDMGGAQRFLYNLSSRLDKKKYELLVAAGLDGGGELFKKLSSIDVPMHKLAYLKRDIRPYYDLVAILEIRKLINSFKPTTLFLNSSKAGFIGSLATVFPSRLSSFRTIYRIGGWTFNDPWPNWKKKMWIFLEKISAHWKDVIIVNNRHDLDQAHALSIVPREKIALIHNGIDVYSMNLLSTEDARSEIIKKILDISGLNVQPKHIIGTVANLYPTKDIESLVEAAQYFGDDDTVFAVIGEGPEYDNLTFSIKHKNLSQKFFLLSHIEDASRLMPAFDVFVLPSLKEGFPWALIEAMTAKVPVIATNVGAVPEIIEDHKNGLIVSPGKPDQIAQAIKEILNSGHLVKELPINAHQTVLFNFNQEKMVSQIETLL